MTIQWCFHLESSHVVACLGGRLVESKFSVPYYYIMYHNPITLWYSLCLFWYLTACLGSKIFMQCNISPYLIIQSWFHWCLIRVNFWCVGSWRVRNNIAYHLLKSTSRSIFVYLVLTSVGVGRLFWQLNSRAYKCGSPIKVYWQLDFCHLGIDICAVRRLVLSVARQTEKKSDTIKTLFRCDLVELFKTKSSWLPFTSS